MPLKPVSRPHKPPAFSFLRRVLSPGATVVLALALVSSVLVWRIKPAPVDGMLFWVFFKTHADTYESAVAKRNALEPDNRVQMQLLNGTVLERRMLSGFFSGTPIADVFEIERTLAARMFTGPLEDVGFLDVTERLKATGLMEQINAPSFSPWMSRGRIFGIPHDVHPVLLAYRSDLVEAAGIDVSQIETWEDFFRVLGPMQQDMDGDGRPDRWLLNMWDTNNEMTQILFYQAGGSYFDEAGNPQINDPKHAAFLARIVTWIAGPKRMCVDLATNSSMGMKQQLDGVVVASMLADWAAGSRKLNLPGLAGKMKLMPLPAWEPGGRRTSVQGGTMIAVNKLSSRIEEAWEFAQELYLSQEGAEELFRKSLIISPIKTMWSLPFYDEPDAYYSGQKVGRMYIDQAPFVPPRPASPYATMAMQFLGNALIEVRSFADKHEIYDEEKLIPEAQRQLDQAQRRLKREIERNTFLTKGSET